MERKKEKAILQCQFCNTIFKRVIKPDTFEIRCPKCREYDVEVIGIEK